MRPALAPRVTMPTRLPALGAVAAALLLALLLISVSAPAQAQDFPKPTGYVGDFADVFDAGTESQLEESLRLVDEETTVELAIVTVPDLGGTDIQDYAVRLFEAWGIGKKGEDNGVLLILALAERRVQIEVGYGLEPYITDSQAGRILDAEVVPDLAAGNYSQGLLNGAYAIRLQIQESGYEPGQPRPATGPDLGFLKPLADIPLWLVITLGLLSLYAVTYMARTRSVWLGGVWGAGVGGVLGWVIGGWAGLGIGLAGLAVGGLFLDAILSSAYRYQSSSGRSTSWGRSWGGFGGAGGGMRSGGFGGFGGGRSGGGGAGRGF